MKILLICSGSWGTGSFETANSLMEEFIVLGHQVKLFFPSMEKPLSNLVSHLEHMIIWKFPIQEGNQSLETYPLILSDPHPGNPHGRMLKDFTTKELTFFFEQLEWQLKICIESFQPEVIECHHIWTAAVVLQRMGKPYYATAHHIDQLGFMNDERMQSSFLEAAKHAKAIFCPSKFIQKEVVDIYQVEEKQSIHIPPGYNHKIFTKTPVNREEVLQTLELDIPGDATIVNFPGKLSKTKGLDLLLEAVKTLPSDKNMHFLIMGAGDQEPCQSFPNVHCLGHQLPKIMAEIHNISRFCVLPSRSEGFGIALLEAMSCGLPIITTIHGGQAEFIVGKTVDPENIVDLSNAILEFYNLPQQEYEALSKQAIKRAHEFTWEYSAKQRLSHFI